MHCLGQLLLALSWVIAAFAQATYNTSAKRGLIYNNKNPWPQDDEIWLNRDLTWYYNYGPQPSSDYANISQANIEFVPMMFDTQKPGFQNSVIELRTNGRNITHVLSFNEPDGDSGSGGSSTDPKVAAQAWLQELAPLQQIGIKVGAPALKGAADDSKYWWGNFTAACEGCTFDFIPLHYYHYPISDTWGAFPGLQWYVSNYSLQEFGNIPRWVTEFAPINETLLQSQDFFNKSIQFLDNASYVERYSYFGPWRSGKSSMGPNSTFLDDAGELTDIGSWYLGGAATNNSPTAGPTPGTSSSGAGPTHKSGALSISHRSGQQIVSWRIILVVGGWILGVYFVL